MSKFRTALLVGLFAGGMPEMTLPDYGDALAKGGKPAKGTVTSKFKATTVRPPEVAPAKGGGRLPPRPPIAAGAASPPKPPQKLTPIFNTAAGKPKPPTKPDTPVPVLRPKGPTLTPGS